MSGVKRYSPEFKVEAVRRSEGCENITALAAELGIRRKRLYHWRDLVRRGGEAALMRGPGRPVGSVGEPRPAGSPKAPIISESAKRIAELERQLGIKQLEVEFFKRAFEHVRGVMDEPTGAGAKASTGGSKSRSRSKDQG